MMDDNNAMFTYTPTRFTNVIHTDRHQKLVQYASSVSVLCGREVKKLMHPMFVKKIN